jgi:general secretion pathway protein I
MILKSTSSRMANKGFTLLEVLVALAVVAITLAALIKGGADSAANASYLRDRSLAHWVGMNVVAEYQLEATWPRPGRFQGDEEMAGQRWYWRAEVSETFDQDVRRLDVRVYADDRTEAQALSSLAAYLPRTPPQESIP